MTRDAEAVLDSNHPVEEGLMQLFHNRFGIRSAAIYKADKGGKYEWISVAGDGNDGLPSDFTKRSAPEIAQLALKTQELATCRSLWDNSDQPVQPQPFIAAITHKGDKSSHILLIRDMPISSISWEDFAKIESIFQYVLVRAKARKAADQAIVSPQPELVAAK